jgi:hypothetical protein
MRARSLLHASCVFPWLALLILAVPSRALAGVRAGFEIGLNYSSLNYYHVDEAPAIYWDPGWRPSFTGGATLELPLRGKFDLVTGLRYVQQGNRVKFETPFPAVGEFRLYHDYLSVPVLLKYHPIAGKQFFISLGPEIGFLLSAHSVIDFAIPDLPSESTDDKDTIESTNVTVDASAGYEFPVAKHVGIVSVRYTRGLTGVAKKEKWLTDWDTRGVELLLGMRW